MKEDVEVLDIEAKEDNDFSVGELQLGNLYNEYEVEVIADRKKFQADEEQYNEGMKILQQRKEDNLVAA